MFTKTSEVPLGSRCRDRITGYEGIAIGNADYLYGCAQVLLKSEELTKEKAVRDGVWFDIQRMEIVPQAAGQRPDFAPDMRVSVAAGGSGGPMADQAPGR